MPLNHHSMPLNHHEMPLNHHEMPLNHHEICAFFSSVKVLGPSVKKDFGDVAGDAGPTEPRWRAAAGPPTAAAAQDRGCASTESQQQQQPLVGPGRAPVGWGILRQIRRFRYVQICSDSGDTVDVGCNYEVVLCGQMSDVTQDIYLYLFIVWFSACATPPGKMSKTAGEAVAVWSLFLLLNLMQLDGPMRFSSTG